MPGLAGFSCGLLSLFKADLAVALLKAMPEFIQRMLGLPIAELATPAGWISIIFVHIVTLLVCGGWAVGRGSDPICGEIGRGTMDLLVTLPVWRPTLIVIPAVAATLGAALLAASIMLGIALGLNTVGIHKEISLVQFTPGAVNLFSMIFCLTGITDLAVVDHSRSLADDYHGGGALSCFYNYRGYLPGRGRPAHGSITAIFYARLSLKN